MSPITRRFGQAVRTTASALAIAVVAWGAASAQGREEQLAARFDATTYERLRVAFASARDRGLPVAPLVDKALEGATKHAPGPRIESAVSALLQRLETSREALAPSPTDGDIASGADALAVGVPREALRSIRSIRPGHSVAVPLAVLAQLVSQGVPVARASNMVETVMRRGATAEQLVALNANVHSDVAAGIAPEAALDVRVRGLTAVLAPPGSAPGSVSLGATTANGTKP